MEAYRTEEEQLEQLRRWWNDNGRATVVAIIVALAIGFGWQGWKQHSQSQREGASDLYQRMLQAFGAPAISSEQRSIALQLAEQLKTDFGGTTYAQFAALQLARAAVADNDLAEAQAQLRWVLGQADKGSDVARVAQLRLARVLAAAGEADQALGILDQGEAGPYRGAYAVARGDILLSLGRQDEAKEAYSAALMLAAGDQGGIDLAVLQQKLQALSPVPVKPVEDAGLPAAVDAAETTDADGGEG